MPGRRHRRAAHGLHMRIRRTTGSGGGHRLKEDAALQIPAVDSIANRTGDRTLTGSGPNADSATFRRRRILLVPVKFFWGMVFCQSVLGALAVLGCTYRLMQRSVLKHWWKLSEPSASTRGFAEFLADDPRTREHTHWPNWFLAQNFREAVRRNSAANLRRHLLGVLNAVGQSLWTNVRLGVQGIFNTWVLAVPEGVLLLFGWYDGWNNSFNKGYEQFSVGPGVSVLGIVLFIAAMLYVPMAQARQAVTGNWRCFYQFRLVWTLVRRRWLACFGLAALYSLCSVPIMILSSFVMFLPNINPKLADLTPAETIQVLNRFYV